MLKYTLCLIRKGNEFLLLNRNKKPQMGMWNGVGGKIEEDETPLESVVRESFEETGIQLTEVRYAGNVIFKSKNSREGMYVFISDLPDGEHVETPANTVEGILEWKAINWIIDEDNRGVANNLKAYLPLILEGKLNLEHTFIYEQHSIVDYKIAEIIQEDINLKCQIIS